MDPIVNYLSKKVLPEDKTEALSVKRKATRFWVSPEGVLYRRAFSTPYLRVVHPNEVESFLFEAHEGICGGHTGGRSLAHRAMSQGFWWPTMKNDALQYVKKCEKCQKFSPKINQPAQPLHPLSNPWPFAQWGLDIMGPFPQAPGGKRFMLVATDYFTKWVEAVPLVNIKDKQVITFLFENIITRFGIPRILISDNGTQFDSRAFRSYCSGLGIKNLYSTPSYPQGNGQAEISNKTLLSGIKKRLDKSKGRWTEELPNVLWTYRTTPRKPTGETPFALAYGMDAVIPLEIGLPTIRTQAVDSGQNGINIARELDLAEERRGQALIRLASYQQCIARHHNKKVRPRGFQIGDWVLRKVNLNTRDPTHGKLGPNWEGPYRITDVGTSGSYRLEDQNGTKVIRPWNVTNLRRFYQ